MYVTSKTGVWDTHAPDITLPKLIIDLPDENPNDLLKVTAQFSARTMTDDLNDGFQYTIEETTHQSLTSLTPAMGIVQGSDVWQLYSVIVLFQIPDAPLDNPLQVELMTGSGGMNGRGAMMNLVLFGELTTLDWVG